MNTALRCTTSAAAGNGLGTTIKYLQRTTSGATGNGRVQRPSTCDAQRAWPQATAWTIKFLRAAAGIGLVATAKYLRSRRTTSAAVGNCLGTTIKYLRGAAGIGLGTTAKYLRRSTSGVAGSGLRTTAKYLRGGAGISLGTTIKYLRRTTSAAANNGLDTTIKYLVNQNAGAGSNWAKGHIHKGRARIQMNSLVV
jgi:hypothetical protein